MKGNPSQPMCGFSAKVVTILKNEGIDFSSVNVLDYPAIREGVKKYSYVMRILSNHFTAFTTKLTLRTFSESDWPTIPQLYVDGQFIGGCDIVTDLHQTGELKNLLKGTKE